MNIRKLRKKLPYTIKQRLKSIYNVIPLSIRYGPVFWNTYKFLQESQWWNKEKLEEYQMQQLEKLLTHSYENVPYYRRIFNESGLKPKDIKSIDDLRKLPFLTRDTVRENLSELVAQNYPKSKLCCVTTGGSIGLPLELYWEKGFTEPKERAFVWRGWSWAGFKHGKKRVILRGDVINRFKDGKRSWWEYNPENNALVLSSYDMADENLPRYIQRINKFKPVAIQGYPSSLYILANFLRSSNLRIINIKSILTSSETLYPYQRKVIEKYLGAKIYDLYGNAERNVLIMECEAGRYHNILEYGIMELIGKRGNLVKKEGKAGEIIATGFNNYAMPFIRYKTGDIAVYKEGKCECGRNYPLLKRIEGRIQEYFIDKTGSAVSFIAHDYCLWDVKDKLNAYQYIQSEQGKVLLKIDANKNFSISDIESVKKKFMKFYPRMDIEIILAKHLPRSKKGKFKYLVQKLPVDFIKS